MVGWIASPKWHRGKVGPPSTHLSDTCVQCERRVWNIGYEHWPGNCRECIIRTRLSQQVGEVVSRTRPWNTITEQIMADFLQTGLQEKHIKRYAYETSYLIMLSGPGMYNDLRILYQAYDQSTSNVPMYQRRSLLSMITLYL